MSDDDWPIAPDVYALMKRCQIGDGNLHRANDILADCYGMLGRLSMRIAAIEAERDAAREDLARVREAAKLAPHHAACDLHPSAHDEDGKPLKDPICTCWKREIKGLD